MAARRDQDPAVFSGGEGRGGRVAPASPDRGVARDAALTADAFCGAGCHELRVRDEGSNWRIVYRIDPDAIVIAEVFAKTTQRTPQHVIETCVKRLKDYDRAAEGE